ncbi:hypothetical protein B0T18DRAFT_424612 [Schizothecium vesticola]|uniref:Uncharacterized protein n=1 Tax=Schizothecium vesticola TaxID=314040 RepID=A0AA40FAF9_9PEZI|nr:hypothetical protein B0T18DRAFT_424612 [Schizothecium vesticola]
MPSAIGIYIGIGIGVAAATVALLTFLHYRRRYRRDQHHLSVITHGQPNPPLPPPSGPAPPSGPMPSAPGPRGPGAHGPGSAGRPDRPPLQGYYAPPGGVAPSREEVEAAAAPPVGGYYAPVYAPVPVPPAPLVLAGAKYV